MYVFAVAIAVLMGVIIATAWVVAAVYVFRDASERNMVNPAMWGFGVLMTGPLGLIAYLIDRPDVRRIECGFCGRPILATDRNCPFCGRDTRTMRS